MKCYSFHEGVVREETVPNETLGFSKRDIAAIAFVLLRAAVLPVKMEARLAISRLSDGKLAVTVSDCGSANGD